MYWPPWYPRLSWGSWQSWSARERWEGWEGCCSWGKGGERGERGPRYVLIWICLWACDKSVQDSHICAPPPPLQVRQECEAWLETGVTLEKRGKGGSRASVQWLLNPPSVSNSLRAKPRPWMWATQSALTPSWSMNRATTTQRRDASPAKSLESTTLPSTPRCTAPACSSTWWRTDTLWLLIFSFMATGPNRHLFQAAPCFTSSPAIRCGCRWLSQSTMDFTPAPRQTAASPASWCTRTGKTLLCLPDMCRFYFLTKTFWTDKWIIRDTIQLYLCNK